MAAPERKACGALGESRWRAVWHADCYCLMSERGFS